MSIGSRAMAACSSGTARDGLDVLPLDGLFELVALVVAGSLDRRERAAPIEGRTMRTRRSTRRQRRGSNREVGQMFCGWDWGSTQHGVCLVADDGKLIKKWLVGHTDAELSTVFAELATFGDVASIPVAIERGEGLVVG